MSFGVVCYKVIDNAILLILYFCMRSHPKTQLVKTTAIILLSSVILEAVWAQLGGFQSLSNSCN